MTEALALAQRLREYPRDKNGNIDRVTCLMWMGEAADRIETDAATIASLRDANKTLTAEVERLKVDAGELVVAQYATSAAEARIAYLEELIAAQHGDVVSRTAKLLHGYTDKIVAAEAKLAKVEADNKTVRESREFWLNAAREENDKLLAVTADRDRLSAELAEARKKLRGNWHGVFLDGRNEHGSHVLMLPQRSIELEQDSNGDFLKGIAETILSDAEALGFEVGQAVVANFDLCLDDGFFDHYEYVGVSDELTTMFYGSPEEQGLAAARSFLASKEASHDHE